VYRILRGHESPHPDVELASPVQEWPLNILLYDTESASGPAIDKCHHLVQVIEYLDAAALVHVGWLHQPQVPLAMLQRHFLLWAEVSVKLLKSLYQLSLLFIFDSRLD
jgi:hypothetical protein